MSRLPKNVFDSPFKSTAQSEQSVSTQSVSTAVPAAETSATKLSVLSDAESSPLPSDTARRAGRKQTVYLSDEQILGLNVEIFEMRRQGKTAREANLTKVISAAVDYYLARRK
ncbi:MAG: hypothetical protein MJE77_16235 [Proteobacteria bacterium]|nr:hypothetical protein [Pseudomonadota bacterium]